MDCTHARLLLNFVRTEELDQAERASLDDHLTGCPECAALAQAESRFDDALETAMPRVPVPSGLKTRILEHLAGERRPRPWPWVAAAALIVGATLAGFFTLSNWAVELDSFAITERVDIKATPEAVEAWFGTALGADITAPREFNFNLLENIDVAQVQGRKVAKLTFRSPNEARAALAHVYVLSSHDFKLPAQPSIRSETHNIEIRRDPSAPDFFYLVIYTSGSLDPFLLQGI